MFLANASGENSLRVAVIAAAAPSDFLLMSQSFNDELMKDFSYVQGVSVVRQCDKPTSNSIEHHNPNSSNFFATF